MRSRNHHARTRAPVAIATAVALVLGACSKGEPEKASAAPAPVVQAPAGAAPPTGDYAPGEALKERLARQEAAARMIDAPAPPLAPVRAPPRAPAPAPAKTPPSPPTVPIAAARSSPPKPVEPVAIAASATAQSPAAAVQAEPPKANPPPAPRTEVAIAKPQPVVATTRLVQRVEPGFPREAIQAGAEKGLVQARLTLDERGNVTRVEVLEANPRRVFDRSVISALSQWKYNDGAAGRTMEVEIAFKK